MRSSQLAVPASGLSLLLALGAGCSPEPPATTAPPPAPLVSYTQGTVNARDGVPIVYESWGKGDAAVVFIHCWACNRRFWRHQVERVADAGYRAVAFDLPGHGESGAGRSDWSIHGLGADAATVIEALGLQRVVLVGHSMGGPVSVAAAPLLAGRVAGIACVDTLHNAEFEIPQDAFDSTVARLRDDYRAGIEAFVPRLLLPDADQSLLQWIVDQAAASNQQGTIALMQDYPRLDMPALLSAAGVPIRCINAAPQNDRGMATALDVNGRYADFDAVLMQGVGHYPQLERPGEFNEKLLEVLAGLLGTG